MNAAKLVLKVVEAVVPPVCLAISVLAAWDNHIDYAIYFVALGIFVRTNRYEG